MDDGLCVVCGLPRTSHQPCEACAVPFRSGADALDRLCDFCRFDPANADWSEPDRVTATDEEIRETRAAGRRLREPSKLERNILDLYARGAVELRTRRVDAAGRFRGWRVTYPPPSQREIARILRCSQAYVSKVLNKVRR